MLCLLNLANILKVFFFFEALLPSLHRKLSKLPCLAVSFMGYCSVLLGFDHFLRTRNSFDVEVGITEYDGNVSVKR